jgi:hypothetical protein
MVSRYCSSRVSRMDMSKLNFFLGSDLLGHAEVLATS